MDGKLNGLKLELLLPAAFLFLADVVGEST